MIHLPKSQPAPVSLATEKTKASGRYNCEDVLLQIQTDFKNKCYICESKEPKAINVEHFVPHRGDIDKKFDWNNLFYCCSHCNNTKLDKPQYDDILNCTDMTHKVESQIHYKMDAFPECDVEIRPNVANPSQCILNTVALLNEIYTGTTTTKKLEANNIRKDILQEIKYFQELLINYYNDENTPEEKQNIEYKIERSLRKSTPYTVFKWWIIWDHPKLKETFGQYISV